MRLERLEVTNFKLLDDVVVDFSTDPSRPLTAIRGENGSGKTSLLLAMLWAFYGAPGLPEFAREMRLSSTSVPVGTTVKIRVMVQFDHEGHAGRNRYRLIRSCSETPTSDDRFKRSAETVNVFEISDSGEDPAPQPEVFLRQVAPTNLRDIFFTNGDDVQTFMSGKVDREDRQGRVHGTIRALLGLVQLYKASSDIGASERRFRHELSKDGGSELAQASAAMDAVEEQIRTTETRIGEIEAEIGMAAQHRERWEGELRTIKDIGDLNRINADLNSTAAQLEQLENHLTQTLNTVRDELSSERLSWAMTPDVLEHGLKALEDLADRGVIPGTSIEIIRDRIKEAVCFCGTPLHDGSDARARLQQLIDDHGNIDEQRQYLTGVHHRARYAKSAHDASTPESGTFANRRVDLLSRLTTIRDEIQTQRAREDDLKQRRGRIDEARVIQLTSDIARAEADINKRRPDLAVLRHEHSGLNTEFERQNAELRTMERRAELSDTKKANATAAGDLKQFVAEVINHLEGEAVQRVARLMSQRFLDIVGSDPTFESAIFAKVTINDNFDIEVWTPQGRRLDFDAEINGASQRALTLAFIWSLMEVAGAEAPRVIDTPLGMVAGAVKERLTIEITTPPPPDGPNYQVVLLLTRSEIRDVEDLIETRAGVIRTITCSKDVKDLRFPWGQDHPQSKVCTCSSRQTCRMCARTYDTDDIEFRDSSEEAR